MGRSAPFDLPQQRIHVQEPHHGPASDLPVVTPCALRTEPDSADADAAMRHIPQRVWADLGALPLEEVSEARRVACRVRDVVADLFAQVRQGGVIDSRGASAVVEDVMASVSRHASALLTLVRMKTREECAHQHAVGVCVLMVCLARQLGMPDQQVRDAGLAGLLHDVGEALSPPEMLDKAGRLDAAESAILRTHSMLGHRLLLACGDVGRPVLDVVLHHHERADGTGYPRQLADGQLSQLARMAAVCDAYDALTSPRAFRAAIPPAEALRLMAGSQGQFDRAMLASLVHVVGAYPIGTVLRLASGRLAVVVETPPAEPQRPRVRLLEVDRGGNACLTRLLDLSRRGMGETDSIRTIVDAAESARLGFEPGFPPWNEAAVIAS